jgi:hypothetical protein
MQMLRMKLTCALFLPLIFLSISCKKAVDSKYSSGQLVSTEEFVTGYLNGSGIWWRSPCFEFIPSSATVPDELTGTNGQRKFFRLTDNADRSLSLYTPVFAGSSDVLSTTLSSGIKPIGGLEDFYLELQLNGHTYTSIGDQAGSQFKIMSASRCVNYDGKHGIMVWIQVECNLYEKNGPGLLKWTKYIGGRSPSPNIILFFQD